MHESAGLHPKYKNNIAEDGSVLVPATVTAVTASMNIQKQWIHSDNAKSVTIFSMYKKEVEHIRGKFSEQCKIQLNEIIENKIKDDKKAKSSNPFTMDDDTVDVAQQETCIVPDPSAYMEEVQMWAGVWKNTQLTKSITNTYNLCLYKI